jgi:hypothetical protein
MLTYERFGREIADQTGIRSRMPYWWRKLGSFRQAARIRYLTDFSHAQGDERGASFIAHDRVLVNAYHLRTLTITCNVIIR